MGIYKTIEAENTFTDWKLFTNNRSVDVSVSGVSDSTVTLQRKFSKYSSEILDVNYWYADEETYFNVATTAYYRIGIKTGDYGTDTVKVRLEV